MDTKVEWLLESLLNGETVEDFTPKSRLEEYLKAVLVKSGTDNLPIPRSRLDALLYELVDKSSNGEEKTYEQGYAEGQASFKGLLGDTVSKYRLPDGFTRLKGDVFGATWSLTEVTIPNTVTYLANGVFRMAYALTKVIFEGGKITTFGSNMFQSDSKLKTVEFGCVIPNGAPNSSTFTGCTALETVTFAQETFGGDVYIHQSSKLKKSCAYEIMRKLANHTGTDNELAYTFKLHATVWANVDDTTAADYEAPPSGTTWQEYVVDYLKYNI